MLFTPEELERECRPLCVQAEEALDVGRLDQVRFLLGRMSSGHLELYWGYLHWLARVLGKVYRDSGEARCESLLSRVAEFLTLPYVERIRRGEEKEAVSALISLWVWQKGLVEPVGETENEVAFRLRPCGSGGRLLLESCHENEPRSYPRTAGGDALFCRLCEHLQAAVNRGVGHTFWSVVREPARQGFCRMSFLKQSRRGERLYAAGELERLTTPRCRQALRLLERGDREIRDLLRDQHREWRPLHDFLCLWVTSLFSLVYREQGGGYLAELVRESYVPLFQSAYVLHALLDEKTVFRDLVRNWHYHQAGFRVTEEEDRFVFSLDPCGSGGRLLRGEMGPAGYFRYGSGPLCRISEGSDITFGRASFPVYCTHCAATNLDQFLGKPWTFLVDGEAMAAPDLPCRQFHYKKSAARRAPVELLRQVGLSAAEPLRKEYQG